MRLWTPRSDGPNLLVHGKICHSNVPSAVETQYGRLDPEGRFPNIGHESSMTIETLYRDIEESPRLAFAIDTCATQLH